MINEFESLNNKTKEYLIFSSKEAEIFSKLTIEELVKNTKNQKDYDIIMGYLLWKLDNVLKMANNNISCIGYKLANENIKLYKLSLKGYKEKFIVNGFN